MGIKVLPPCVNDSDAQLHPGRHRHPLRPDRDPQRRRQRRRLDRRDPRRRRAQFADFGDFLRKVDAVVCNKRTIEALIKGGAFDSLGHTAARADQRLRAGRRRGARHQAGRGDRPVRPVRLGRCRAGDRMPATTCSRSRRPRASGTRRCCCSSSARCSASTSPTTRCSGSSTCSPRAADSSIALGAGRGADEPQLGHSRRHPVRGQPPGDQGGAAVGAGRARGPRGLDRGDVLPGDLRAGRADDRRGRRSSRSRAAPTPARTPSS